MKRFAIFISILAMAALAPAQDVPAKPDFSGNWTEGSAATAGPAGQQAGRGGQQGRGQRGRGAGGQRGRGGGGRGGGSSLGSGWGPCFSIAQAENLVTFERNFFSRGDLQRPIKYRYALDGSETRNTLFMGRGLQEETAKSAWEGESLVISITHKFRNPETGQMEDYVVRQVLSLVQGETPETPPMLAIETTRPGALGGPSSTTRTTYVRG